MSTAKVFEKAYRDCFAVHQAFRRVGFLSDQIFVGFGEVSGRADTLHVQLQAQGKTFTVPVAQMPGAKFDDVIATWQAFATALPGMAEIDLQRFWDESPISRQSVAFVAALIGKGFALPRSEAAE